jgi:putative FmdB family regulatory protein
MPNYEFRCKNCQAVFERFLPLAEYDNPQKCECGGDSNKLISKCSFINTGPNRPIDSVIGADAEKRWETVYKRKNEKQRKRVKKIKEKLKETGA